MPSTIKITDFNRGNIFLNFGDIENIDPPSSTKGSLIIKDFKNPIDQLRVREVLKDEEVDVSFFPHELDILKSTFAAPP